MTRSQVIAECVAENVAAYTKRGAQLARHRAGRGQKPDESDRDYERALQDIDVCIASAEGMRNWWESGEGEKHLWKTTV